MITVSTHQLPSLVTKLLTRKVVCFQAHEYFSSEHSWLVNVMPEQTKLLDEALAELKEDAHILALAALHNPYND